MRHFISILIVSLDSLENEFFNNIGKRVVLILYYTSCRFSKVIDFQAGWIELGRSRRTAFRKTSKKNSSRPRGKLFDYASIFQEQTLYLYVLQFSDGFQTYILYYHEHKENTVYYIIYILYIIYIILYIIYINWILLLILYMCNTRLTRKIQLRLNPFHLAWKSNTSEKQQPSV